jgi:hypothetical protein
LTPTESIIGMEPGTKTVRREVRRTATNDRQPAQKSGADRDPISSVAAPRSRFVPELRTPA